MSAALDFQSIIFNLQTYWASQGCLIGQPYYSQVGAGTMNPATFLRVLGPEPWRVAYVEPSVRPDDGRYGVNPNRLQQHHQFQVILKPDPGNPQELYLNSLLALGIDPKEHDIRFVEDNWESPALSAWGLGWEVWLDGQEITQFTYFQQSGGMALEVPSVEITYGLERIAMTLQKVRDFKQIRWNESRLYGDLYQVAEREHSTYYYEAADIPRLKEMFNLFVGEAENALSQKLVLPAYDNVIKSSHTFNILDARGAVGFTERQALFGKMRDLSKRVAESYLSQREEMGFPWLESNQPVLKMESEALPEIEGNLADFLLEIGTEELPTAEVDSALEQLDKNVKAMLADARLNYEKLEVQGTPRRLAVMISNLETSQPDRVNEFKGPSADRAFDAEGRATKAAEGFARGRGVEVADLQVRDFEGGRYVVARVAEKGRPALEVLVDALPQLCASLRFTKSMRWNSSGVSFSRPVRWLLALLGDAVIPFNFAGVSSGRVTHGLRFSKEEQKAIDSIQAYQNYLEREGILLDQIKRRDEIWQQALALAEKTGGTLAKDEGLLGEVCNLVEKPTALLGSFDQRYLENLPGEVLIAVMKKHQRYFPVLDQNHKLTNHFILIRNGSKEDAANVVDGNLQVILARFADAEFFIQEDRQKSLEEFIPKLSQLTFQKQLGSMLDKSKRISALTEAVSQKLGLSQAEQKLAKRVASLCKADLASEMVVEMTSLQGVMGRYYAELSGEPSAVAEAIFEHYLPRNTEDILPESSAGTLVGIADRLDSIAGLFAVGLAPTGSKDPFALRRAALGLAQLLIGKDLDFDLRWGLQQAGRLQPVPFEANTLQASLEFVIGRLHGLLLEKGLRYDVVDAVEHAQGTNPTRAAQDAEILNAWVKRADWPEILPAYSRCVRITRDLKETYLPNPQIFEEEEETYLYQNLVEAEQKLVLKPGVENALNLVKDLVLPINTFFDHVMVMVEDIELQQSRLGLLQRISNLLKPYADLSRLEGF